MRLICTIIINKKTRIKKYIKNNIIIIIYNNNNNNIKREKTA